MTTEHHGSYDTNEELELVQKCQEGDRVAFDELVLKYQQRVFAIALGMLGNYDEAKDVVQDTFIKVFKTIQTFQHKSKFSTWLFSVVANLCRHRRRWWARRKKHIVASLDDPTTTEEGSILRQVADRLPTSSTLAMRTEMHQRLMAALKNLDEPARQMVILRDIKEFSYDEIALLLSCRLGTVKSRLNRARHRLKNLLEKEPE